MFNDCSKLNCCNNLANHSKSVSAASERRDGQCVDLCVCIYSIYTRTRIRLQCIVHTVYENALLFSLEY